MALNDLNILEEDGFAMGAKLIISESVQDCFCS